MHYHVTHSKISNKLRIFFSSFILDLDLRTVLKFFEFPPPVFFIILTEIGPEVTASHIVGERKSFEHALPVGTVTVWVGAEALSRKPKPRRDSTRERCRWRSRGGVWDVFSLRWTLNRNWRASSRLPRFPTRARSTSTIARSADVHAFYTHTHTHTHTYTTRARVR